MSKTTRNCMGNCTRKCSACKYRKWRGDYSLFICEISGKVIEPYYYCDIPDEVVKDYNGEICRPKMKNKGGNENA